MKKVLVLLSAYNGEKYLPEQLDSLLGQKGVEVHILIRDDGSTDGTISLVEIYIQEHPEKIELVKGENVGWKASFFSLMNLALPTSANYDYFAFSDQDDICLPNKFEVAVEQLDQMKNPLKLYCSNCFYYEDGINRGLIRKRPVMAPTIENCLIRNLATGCTEVFSREFLVVATKYKPEPYPAHDMWTYQLATILGEVYIDFNSYILYRQHSNNQIGARSGKLAIWKRRIKSLINPVDKHERETRAREILKGYSALLTPDTKQKIELVANYRNSLASRFKLIFNTRYTTGIRSNDFWLRLRILFGKL
jgi:glycosyltransferase involved in cell wall biosynthesis